MRYDANGNMAPDKLKATDKIDGMVALMMAWGRAMFREKDNIFIYHEGSLSKIDLNEKEDEMTRKKKTQKEEIEKEEIKNEEALKNETQEPQQVEILCKRCGKDVTGMDICKECGLVTKLRV